MSADLSPDHPLAPLRQAVEQSRLGRAKAKFSNALKWQIVSELERYSASQLAQALDIGVGCLLRWKRQFMQGDIQRSENANSLVSPAQSGFVTLAPHSAKTAAVHSDTFEMNLVLQCEQASQPIHLKAHITLAQWQQILPLISQALLT